MQINNASFEISPSPLEIQREIVAYTAQSPQGESERKMVAGNQELIRIYEAKVKQVIARVWKG